MNTNQIIATVNSVSTNTWITVGTIAVIIILVVAGTIYLVLSMIVKNIKGKYTHVDKQTYDFGSPEEEPDRSIAQSLESRDYSHCLKECFEEVKLELMKALKSNGWLKKSESQFASYKMEIIHHLDNVHSECLNNGYYYGSKLRREDLYEWNKTLEPVVTTTYLEMFDNLVEILRQSKQTLDAYEKEMENISNSKVCDPERVQKCQVMFQVVRLAQDMFQEKWITCVDRCEAEVDRTMKALVMVFFGHYLKKYKDIVKGRSV